MARRSGRAYNQRAHEGKLPQGGSDDAMSVYIDINCDMGESYGRWTLGHDAEIILMTMAMTKYDTEARKVKGIRVAAEGFADRVYADDGQLVSRKLGKDALVTDPSKAADQAVRMVLEGKVQTISGKVIDVKVQ